MSKKLTNEIIDLRVLNENPSLKRIDNYIDFKTEIHWQCLKCDYIWSAKPSNILCRGDGCPKCNNKIKLTNEIIDERLKKRNIKNIIRVESIGKNSNTPIKWKCLKCGYIWKTRPNYILNKKKSKCPKCQRCAKLSNDEVDKRIKSDKRNIKRLGKYKNISTPIDWQCLKCDYIWSATPDDVIGNRKTGCPKCAGRFKLTNEDIDNRLKSNKRNIKRIENYKSLNKKIEWLCLECNNIWSASPDGVVGKRQSGCPNCNALSKGEKITNQVLKDLEISNIKRQHSLKNIEIKNEDGEVIQTLLTVDFEIILRNRRIIIEYNGSQHYRPERFRSKISKKESEKRFRKQQYRDNWLREYCDRKNILLVEIDGRYIKEYRDIKEYLENALGDLLYL